MRSEELGANLFRITQTEAVLREDNIIGENNANKTHYDIGKNIRETIKKNHRKKFKRIRKREKKDSNKLFQDKNSL